jgi:hypothetical protein
VGDPVGGSAVVGVSAMGARSDEREVGAARGMLSDWQAASKLIVNNTNKIETIFLLIARPPITTPK